jgi:hypothetical protein
VRTKCVGSAIPQPVTDELLGCLREQLDAYVRADNLVGPYHLLTTVTHQARQLEQVVARAPTRLRREALELCSRYTELAGWLYQDAGVPASAQFWSDRALDYAEELGARCSARTCLCARATWPPTPGTRPAR